MLQLYLRTETKENKKGHYIEPVRDHNSPYEENVDLYYTKYLCTYALCNIVFFGSWHNTKIIRGTFIGLHLFLFRILIIFIWSPEILTGICHCSLISVACEFLFEFLRPLKKLLTNVYSCHLVCGIVKSKHEGPWLILNYHISCHKFNKRRMMYLSIFNAWSVTRLLYPYRQINTLS